MKLQTAVPLLDLVTDALRERQDSRRWQVTPRGPWCTVIPVGHELRRQGWKLHVAATPASAGDVLARSLPILLDAGCAFKLAATLADVVHLNGPHYPREGAGKFLTVYPDDRVQFSIVAFSRPGTLLARSSGSIGRALQQRMTDHYVDAMLEYCRPSHRGG